ncbi:MAG: hypothetical protein H6559_35995 [Lewinellaceae bacterium]|nr:hypothetical protein [Lewinellaceae bacterium]
MSEDDDYSPLFAYRHGLQDFPAENAAEKLLPYAATTSRDGATICWRSPITSHSMDAANSDFEIRIDGVPAPVSSTPSAPPILTRASSFCR